MNWSDLDLSSEHRQMLRASGITPELAYQRGYRTITDANELMELGYSKAQANVPALFVPTLDESGNVAAHQIRPENPRILESGREIKYDTPKGQANRLDIHPSRRGDLSNPGVPLIITEGVKKGDSAIAQGYACVALAGVWSWRGQNNNGGKTAIADWHDVALNGRKVAICYDNDVMQKNEVQTAARALAKYLESKGANVSYILLPENNGEKMGLDDFLVDTGDNPWNFEVSELPSRAQQNSDMGLWYSDSSMALRWQDTEGGSQHRWLADEGKWMRFVDGRWTVKGGLSGAKSSVGELLFEEEQIVRKRGDFQVAKDLGSSAKLNNVLHRAATLPKMSVYEEDFDAQPELFNCANGVIDLRTGELLDHEPTFMLTQGSPVVYDPEAEAHEFRTFIEWALPNPEVRAYVQRLFGQAMIGKVQEHVFPVFTGTGGNGKGTLIRLMMHVMGSEYSTMVSRKLLVRGQFEEHATMYATLYKRRLAITEETGKNAELSTEVVKTLSGGDAINARKMRQDEFTFMPTHTLVMVTNNLPKVEEDEEALWRRLRIIPFNSKVTRPDVHLEDRLKKEDSGILNWMLEGAKMWYQEGLGEPIDVMLATTQYHVQSDPLSEYWDEKVDETGKAEDRLPVREVFESYKTWMQEERPDDEPHKSINQFSQAVRNKFKLEAKRVGRDKVQNWTGIKWKSGGDDYAPSQDTDPNAREVDITGHHETVTAQTAPPLRYDENPPKMGAVQSTSEVMSTPDVHPKTRSDQGKEAMWTSGHHFFTYSDPKAQTAPSGLAVEENLGSISFSDVHMSTSQSVNLDSMRGTLLDALKQPYRGDWVQDLFPTKGMRPRCQQCRSYQSLMPGAFVLWNCESCYPDNFEE